MLKGLLSLLLGLWLTSIGTDLFTAQARFIFGQSVLLGGIDVMVISFDLGPQFDTRTAASVFGSVEDAREDFGVESVYLFAANLEPGLERKQLIQKVQQSVAILDYDFRTVGRVPGADAVGSDKCEKF